MQKNIKIHDGVIKKALYKEAVKIYEIKENIYWFTMFFTLGTMSVYTSNKEKESNENKPKQQEAVKDNEDEQKEIEGQKKKR